VTVTPSAPAPRWKRAARRWAAPLLLAAGACSGESGVEAGALAAEPGWTTPIRLARVGDTVAVRCEYLAPARAPAPDAVVRSRRGVLRGSECGSLVVQRSGVDTLDISTARAATRLVVAVAVPPAPLGPRLAAAARLDSFPAGMVPWAPTVRRNGRGQVELYSTAYRGQYGDPDRGGNLLRYLSRDGRRFTYDGVALAPPREDGCETRAHGVEHVAVMPRQDAPGWRMLFAAGGYCRGWQVYSAVSADERTWTVEPGVRVSNRLALPGHSLGQGEGMDVARLPGGEWQLLVGGGQLEPPADTWQINEFRSWNQVDWRYVGPALHTSAMPSAARGGIYSPSVTEFVPGIHRMYFGGDNRGQTPLRFAVFSAVSRDRLEWQFEGEVLGDASTQFYYAAFLDQRLFFIRGGAAQEIATTAVRMP
jgi:hypothetical protein